MLGPSDPSMGQPMLGLTPDRSRIRPKAKSRIRAAAVQFPALLVPGLSPVSIKGIQAALRGPLGPSVDRVRPALAEGQRCGITRTRAGKWDRTFFGLRCGTAGCRRRALASICRVAPVRRKRTNRARARDALRNLVTGAGAPPSPPRLGALCLTRLPTIGDLPGRNLRMLRSRALSVNSSSGQLTNGKSGTGPAFS
jgi:hypothetical protein